MYTTSILAISVCACSSGLFSRLKEPKKNKKIKSGPLDWGFYFLAPTTSKKC